MGGFLRSEGYEVDCAMTAEQALAFLRKNSYEAIFLDINPGLTDGLNLMPDVKATQSFAHLIVVSAYGDESVREAARKAGVSGFILKPFSNIQISRSLEK
jgi:DNA-binding response OmpR family regulator